MSLPGRRSLRERIRYRFDNLITRGTGAILLWLAALTFVVVVVAALVLSVFDVSYTSSEKDSWPEDFWQTLLRTIDPGTMASDVGWGRRLLALAVTVFGILVAGTLIGIIATGFEQRVDGLRRGRSPVPERGHVVVLGNSPILGALLLELSAAPRSGRGRTVVALSTREPGDLERELFHVLKEAGVELVTRWGDPTSTSDLDMVGVDRAGAVVVLNEETQGDAGVIRAVLAVGAVCGSYDRMPIVAEIVDPANARTLVNACGSSVHPIVMDQTLSRIAAIGLRQPGMYRVVEDLADFGRCAMYFIAVDDLAGHSFSEAVFWYERCRPIGVVGTDGRFELVPDPDRPFASGEELIVIAHDQTPVRSRIASGPTALAGRRHRLSEEALVTTRLVGWDEFGARLLLELDRFAAPGSWARIVGGDRVRGAEIDLPELSTIEVTVSSATGPDALLGDPDAPEDRRAPGSVVLLGTPGDDDPDEVDAKTLLDLVLLRRSMDDPSFAASTSGARRPRVVVELLDARSVELAQRVGADDLVVSDALASKLLAQIALDPRRRLVLLELYGPTGPSIGLVDASELDLAGERTFRDVARVAYSVGLSAIGWHRRGPAGDVVELNPLEDRPVVLTDHDRVVVVGPTDAGTVTR